MATQLKVQLTLKIDLISKIHHQNTTSLHPYTYQRTWTQRRWICQLNLARNGRTSCGEIGCRSCCRSYQIQKNGRQSTATCRSTWHRQNSNRNGIVSRIRSKSTILSYGGFRSVFIIGEENGGFDVKFQALDRYKNKIDEIGMVG
jgi:hypothetical protein